MKLEEQIVNQTIAYSLEGMEDIGMSIDDQILAQVIAQSLEDNATAGHSVISLDDDSHDMKIPSTITFELKVPFFINYETKDLK